MELQECEAIDQEVGAANRVADRAIIGAGRADPFPEAINKVCADSSSPQKRFDSMPKSPTDEADEPAGCSHRAGFWRPAIFVAATAARRLASNSQTGMACRLWRDQRGTIALTTGICAPVLAGFAALAIDVASWEAAQRSMQGAADMAAYSAAIAYGKNNGTSIVSQAKGITAQIGYVDGLKGVTVTVNQPPTTGSHTSDATAIEVIVTQPQARFFAGLFLSGNPTVKSRAVATTSTSGGSACILALNATANQAINVSGSGSIQSPGCDVVANSTSTSAINMSGSAAINASCLVTPGNVNTTSGLTEHNCTTPKIHATATADPYASVPAPTASGACLTVPGGSPVTLSPGHYCSGLSVNGTATFQPGTYYVDGNFAIQGSAHATGTGVTFYYTGTNFAISGSATATLSAPTTGTYAGILFFGSRSVTNGNNAISGGTTANLTGAIYFPTQSVTFSGGSSSGSSCTQIVADKVTVSGASYLNGGCTTKISVADGTSTGSVKVVE